MEEIIINTVILIAGFVAGFNWKNNKKLQTDARICTNIECNPKGYANCQDFDSCEKRTAEL